MDEDNKQFEALDVEPTKLRRTMDIQLLSLINKYHEDINELRKEFSEYFKDIRAIVEKTNTNIMTIKSDADSIRQTLDKEICPKLERHDKTLYGKPEESGINNTGLVNQVATTQNEIKTFKGAFIYIWGVVVPILSAVISFAVMKVLGK